MSLPGWDAENPDHEEQGVAIAQYLTDSRLTTIEMNEGTIYRITATGIDEVEKDGAQALALRAVLSAAGKKIT
jgi:hypothetical protein